MFDSESLYNPQFITFMFEVSLIIKRWSIRGIKQRENKLDH